MDINRDIELPFNYSDDIIKNIIIIIISIILIMLFDKFLRPKLVKIINKPSIPRLKNKYLRKLESLYNKVSQNKMDVRSSYATLSNIVREFVEKATGIKASSFSKNDAHRFGMDDLRILMEDYYPPEFAERDTGDILNSIKKSMEVIKEWKEK